MFIELKSIPHHRGQVLHDLSILKADNPLLHLTQSLLPPGIIFLLQVMDISIHFKDQRRLVTIEIDDESLNDLLPPKVDSQFIRP